MAHHSSLQPRAATDGMRSLLLQGSYTNSWLPWPHHQVIIDMVPERHIAWQKKRARRIAVRHRLHIDTAYELWQARQSAVTAPLSRRTLLCFARSETSQGWIDQALPLVPLLREAHLHRSAFELLQWIVGADQLFNSCGCPDNSGLCQTCLLGASPRTEHALKQETCRHWQRREAELLCAAWARRYHFTDGLLELQAKDHGRWQMLAALEECDPLVFQAALTALHGGNEALALPERLRQWALVSAEELAIAAARVRHIDRHAGCDRIYFGTQYLIAQLLAEKAGQSFAFAESGDAAATDSVSDEVHAAISHLLCNAFNALQDGN
ncbi:MAG: hypothetical protein U0105_22500 [Candidatus Obscuribacterales bacterium]